jgi:hypothetical protein
MRWWPRQENKTPADPRGTQEPRGASQPDSAKLNQLRGLVLDARRKPGLSSADRPDEEHGRIAGIRWRRRQNIIDQEVPV